MQGAELGARCFALNRILAHLFRDAKEAGVDHLLQLQHGPCGDWELPRRPSVAIVNPPWGQRLLSDRSAHDDDGGGNDGFRRGRNSQQGQDSAPDPGLVDAWKQLARFFKVCLLGTHFFIHDFTRHLPLCWSRF